jgi:hypothetical protein
VGTPYQVASKGRVYTVVDDLTIVRHGVVIGQVIDDETEQGVRTPLSIQVDWMGGYARDFGDGWFCVSGELADLFDRSGGAPVVLEIRVSAADYQEQTEEVMISPGTMLPVTVEMRLVR